MKHGRNQLLPVIVIVIVVVLSVAAIVSLVRTFFFSGDREDTQTTQQRDSDEAALLNTSADRGVRMTVRGDITADEKFRSYQIVITPTNRTMTTYAGYLDRPIDSATRSNNTKAYEQFVHALNFEKMMSGEPLKDDKNDTRGICADGKVLEFETLQNNQTVKRLWTSTCKGFPGSLKASAGRLSDLFLEQVPESRDLIKNINKR